MSSNELVDMNAPAEEPEKMARHMLLLTVHSAEKLQLATSTSSYFKVYVGDAPVVASTTNVLGENSLPDHLMLHGQVTTSKVKTAALWEEQFELPVHNIKTDILSIRVKSKHMLMSPSIGSCVIPLRQFKLDTDIDQAFPLVRDATEVGTIRLQMTLRLNYVMTEKEKNLRRRIEKLEKKQRRIKQELRRLRVEADALVPGNKNPFEEDELKLCDAASGDVLQTVTHEELPSDSASDEDELHNDSQRPKTRSKCKSLLHSSSSPSSSESEDDGDSNGVIVALTPQQIMARTGGGDSSELTEDQVRNAGLGAFNAVASGKEGNVLETAVNALEVLEVLAPYIGRKMQEASAKVAQMMDSPEQLTSEDRKMTCEKELIKPNDPSPAAAAV